MLPSPTKIGIPAPTASCLVLPSPDVPSLAARSLMPERSGLPAGSGGQKFRYSMSLVLFALHVPSLGEALEEGAVAEDRDWSAAKTSFPQAKKPKRAKRVEIQYTRIISS